MPSTPAQPQLPFSIKPFFSCSPNPTPFTLTTSLLLQGGPSHLSLPTGGQSMHPPPGSPPWMSQLHAGGSLDLSEPSLAFSYGNILPPSWALSHSSRKPGQRRIFPVKRPSNPTSFDLNIWGGWCRQWPQVWTDTHLILFTHCGPG